MSTMTLIVFVFSKFDNVTSTSAMQVAWLFSCTWPWCSSAYWFCMSRLLSARSQHTSGGTCFAFITVNICLSLVVWCRL